MIQCPKRYVLLLLMIMWGAAAREGVARGEGLFSTTSEPTDVRPEEVVRWEADSAQVNPDGSVSVNARLFAQDGYTLYADQIRFTSTSGYIPDQFVGPAPISLVDPVTNKTVNVYGSGEFQLTFRGLEPLSGDTFPLAIRFIACTHKICLFPYTENLKVPLYKATSLGATTAPAPSLAPPPTESTPPQTDRSAGLEDRLAEQLTGEQLSLLALILIMLLGGFLTNLTPCVYPMIPITIRLLGKQSRSPLRGAVFYALGITSSYTALGMIAAVTGGLFGQLMANEAFNAFLALVMFGFGYTMIASKGFAFVQRLGVKIGSSEAPGWRKAYLMGCGAGLVASPCTGPILAALLTYTASRLTVWESTLLLTSYSVGFSLPYILLGGLAARFAQTKVSPLLQQWVKLLFASIMFALAFYYLRIPAYRWLNQLAPYWGMLSIIGIAVGLAASAILIAVHRYFDSIFIVSALLAGFGIFAGTQWFNQTRSISSHVELRWFNSEDEALKIAAAEHRPVLIDFWAEWCEACKKMDRSTFSDAEAIKALKDANFVLLRLDVTESSDAADQLLARYGIQSLPSVVLIPAQPKAERVVIMGFVSVSALLNKISTLERK